MSNFTHVCIKPGCGASYQDTDPDPYYCNDCDKARKQIAAQVDAKFAARPKKHVPNFEERMGQYATMKGITMINLPRNGNQ